MCVVRMANPPNCLRRKKKFSRRKFRAFRRTALRKWRRRKKKMVGIGPLNFFRCKAGPPIRDSHR